VEPDSSRTAATGNGQRGRSQGVRSVIRSVLVGTVVWCWAREAAQGRTCLGDRARTGGRGGHKDGAPRLANHDEGAALEQGMGIRRHRAVDQLLPDLR
jgi:hypothetical protein